MLEDVNFDEAKQSQLPLVELLINMGYTYISVADALAQRGGDTSKFLLRDIARQSLMRINRYEHNGELFPFGEKDVSEAVEELESITLEDGLLDTSKKIYHAVMPTKGGKTIKVFHGGSFESKSFRFIDFEHPANNDFHVTVEYTATGKESVRADIVCFVNGIPFVVIENKKSSVDVQKALTQLRKYQSADKVPKLFVYLQILIGTNGSEFLYGTTNTPNKFYANWREKEETHEGFISEVKQLIAKKIDQKVHTQVLRDLNGSTYGHEQKTERRVKEQDYGTVAMLSKDRVLDIAKNFILYDAGVKKVMRYQQYFAIRKILKRVEELEPVAGGGEKRRGGIVWHTQGSGKSLTMVMFVKALIESPYIINPRVIIVTDRKDLDRQIKGTFQNAGLKKKILQATSGEDLLEKIKSKDSAVITTLVHKFHTASKKRAEFTDTDQNIFVLIDEAHRTHGGEASLEMTRTIPNACYIAFTGTPLLKGEKSEQKFGTFIDRYTIDDALKDNIILPLIYEGRYVELRQDSDEVDRLSDRVTEDLSAKQKYLLHKSAREEMLNDNPKAIKEIYYDIEKHYINRFQGTGLKAQIVAPSKYAATLFQKYFVASAKVQTALVISDGDGDIPEDDDHKVEVGEYLKEIKSNYQSLQSYEKEVINSFTHNEDGIEILIVVDKLLTGFDAPRNTVLYLTRKLQDHGLLQAIARVNRLFDNPDFPKTAGYIIDYSENAQNIDTAMELFGNYDENDVKGALVSVGDKIHELEVAYSTMVDLFKGVSVDDQALLEHLADEPTRREFNGAFNTFLHVFSECLILQDFPNKFDQVDLFKREAKKFENLKKSAALQYGDYVDLRQYKLELVRILDENIKASAAEVLTEEIDISDRDRLHKAIEELHSDASKAEAIAAQTNRHITEQRQKDEKLYERFSQRIREILDAMREKKLADIEALKQLRLIEDEVYSRKDATLPRAILSVKGADIMYRNLRDNFHQVTDGMLYEKIVLGIATIVKSSATVDWWRSHEAKRLMRNRLDDYLYDEVKIGYGIGLGYEQIEKTINIILGLAENNHEIYT